MTVTTYDQVDGILDSWAQSHPALDLSTKDVTFRIQQLAAHLEGEATPILEQLGLKPGIFALSAILHRQGHPHESSPRALAAQLNMSSGGMSNLLDRAEDLRFVTRMPDPVDGRSVIVKLTSFGQATLEKALQRQTEQEQALMDHLTRREQATLTQLLRKLLGAAEQQKAQDLATGRAAALYRTAHNDQAQSETAQDKVTQTSVSSVTLGAPYSSNL